MACKCVQKVLTACCPHVLSCSSGPTPALSLIVGKDSNAPLIASHVSPCDSNCVEPTLMVRLDLI